MDLGGAAREPIEFAAAMDTDSMIERFADDEYDPTAVVHAFREG